LQSHRGEHGIDRYGGKERPPFSRTGVKEEENMLCRAMPLNLTRFPHHQLSENEMSQFPVDSVCAAWRRNKPMEEHMLAKHLTWALFGTALIAAPALAQTNPPAGTSAPASGTNQPAVTTTAPASGPMTTGNWMTQEQPGQWRASKLEGLDVYNQNDEKIGDISELIVDGSGKIQAVVVGVGGFLGIGERNVALPFDQIKFVNEPRATATATIANPNAPATPAAPGTTANPNNPNAPATTGTTTTRPMDTGNRSAPDHAVLTMNMTKDQLKAAPEFKYAR
jgi:sporulation protein YlmC with PRC-barrel domain